MVLQTRLALVSVLAAVLSHTARFPAPCYCCDERGHLCRRERIFEEFLRASDLAPN